LEGQDKTIHEGFTFPIFFWVGEKLEYKVRRASPSRSGQGVFKIKHEMSHPPYYFEKTIEYQGFEDEVHKIYLGTGWNKVKINSPGIENLLVTVFR